MKNKFKLVLVVTALMLFKNVTFAQKTFGTAVEYLTFIGEQYEQLTDDQWSYTRAVANDKSARKVENKRQDLLQTNKSAQSKISSLSGFEGDTEYRDSVVAFLELNYNVLNNDYEKIMNMEAIAEQSYDLMEAYLLAQEIASEKIKSASEMLAARHKKFAEANNINLIESSSKKSKKLEKASLVYKYYNKLYLIFFKAYKQEAYLLDAVSRGDVNAMEQSKNALLEYSQEGLDKLKEMRAFGDDNSLKEACSKMLNFYKEEATDKSPTIINFFLKMEKFKSIQEAFNGKKEKKRTQEDVDQFNEAVNDYNSATNEYNTTNEYLNKARSKNINNWNSGATKFTKRHV